MKAFQHILVPIDFSEPSREALRYAVAIGEKFDSKITLLHVVQDIALMLPDAIPPSPLPIPTLEQMSEAAKRQCADLIRSENLSARGIRTEVRIGSPYNEILAFAREDATGLIVMSTHGRSGLSHLFMGSVAERVVRHAPCPVLTVREEKKK